MRPQTHDVFVLVVHKEQINEEKTIIKKVIVKSFQDLKKDFNLQSQMVTNESMSKEPPKIMHIIMKVKNINKKQTTLKDSRMDKSNYTKLTRHKSPKPFTNSFKNMARLQSKVWKAHD